jgi:hypothetical protein
MSRSILAYPFAKNSRERLIAGNRTPFHAVMPGHYYGYSRRKTNGIAAISARRHGRQTMANQCFDCFWGHYLRVAADHIDFAQMVTDPGSKNAPRHKFMKKRTANSSKFDEPQSLVMTHSYKAFSDVVAC